MVTKTIQSEKLEEAAEEMRKVVKNAKRKLLEFDVMMSEAEIKAGQFETFNTAKELIKSLE